MKVFFANAISNLDRHRIRPFVSLAMACALWTWAQAVQADTPPTGTAPVNPPAGGFAIDGNLLANNPTNGIGDWVTNSAGGGAVLRTNGAPYDTNATIHIVDLYDSGSDNIFSGGLKVNDNPNLWTWVASKPPSKNDINHGLLHITQDANGHIWAMVSGDRLSENGASYIDFEFLQNTLAVNTNGTFSSAGPNCGRTTNDFLMTVAFTGGGSTAEFFIQRWQPTNSQPCGFDYLDSPCPTNKVFAAANAGSVPVPYGAFGGTTYAENLFAEAAVDLTALVSGFDPCLSIGVRTILIKTKTSQSATAAIKDFVSPVQVNLRLGPVSDAGPDLAKCMEGATTSFTMNGFVQAGSVPLTSTNWSVVSGPATITTVNSLSTTVIVTGAMATATLRLSVTDLVGCTKTDDVILTVNPLPACSISGLSPICPGSSHTYDGPAGMTSYLWSISGDGAISGSSNSPSVSVVAGSGCDSSFTLSLTLVNSNGCSNTCSQSFAIKDTTPPSILCPGPVTVQCASAIPAPNVANVTATDTCSTATVMHVNDALSASNCVNQFTLIRTYRATDQCGNTNDCAQLITVNDSTPPLIGAAGADATLECPAVPVFTPPTATDNCAPAPTVVEISDVTVPGCGGTFTRTKTWRAVDACGNMSGTVSQTIAVVDTTGPVITALPGPSTIQCPAMPQFATPTATDACGGAVDLTSADMTTPGACPNERSVTRTWTAFDLCGNVTTASQTITVEDKIGPVITELPGPSTIQCPATPQFATPTATDACGGAVDLTSADTTTPGACAHEYMVTRTWTAVDLCGNITTASQTITVEDKIGPVITELPGSSTIQCPAMPQFATPTATDACGGAVDLTSADTTTPGSCPNERSVTRIWTAVDLCGNVTTASQTIIVEDKIGPVITELPGPSTILCPAAPQFATPTATDACGGAVDLTSTDMTVPGICPQRYSVTRTWTAVDLCGNVSTASQTITVEDNSGPVITSLPEPTTIQCPAMPQFATPTATDGCGGAVDLTSADTSTPGACAHEYTVTRTWTAVDLCGNVTTASQTIMVEDKIGPIITELPGPSTIQCPATPQFATPTATDACGGAVDLTSADTTTPGSCPSERSVTRTWTAVDLCGNVTTASQTISVEDKIGPVITELPGPSTIQCPATPQFATPTAMDACGGAVDLTSADTTTPGACPNERSVTRTWTAVDLCGNVTTASQTITVEDNIGPVITELPGPSTIQCPAMPQFATPTATDACGGAVDLTSADTTTPGSCPNERSVTRTWTAVDLCGNVTTASQTISVEDKIGPVITELPGPSTILCPATPQFATPTATDACGGAVDLTSTDMTVPGICPQRYSTTRTWTAVDLCGNASTASQTITVEDNSGPVISELPAPSTIQCPAMPQFATPTATDGCGGAVDLTSADTTTPGACAYEYTVTRTWTAVDLCGNVSTASQTITVEDKIGPVITELPAPSTIQCPATPQFATPTATDACGDAVDLTSADIITPGACPNERSVTRTWTAVDLCGNVTTASQTITVEDRIGPVITALPGPSTIQCPATPQFATPTATDACGGAVDLTSADTTTPGACPNERLVTRTWTAVDLCGNVTTASQTITVEDKIGPVITELPGPSTIQCPAMPQFATPTATDACGGAVDLTSTDATVPGICPQRHSVTRTWTAVDLCGNVTTASQTITVEDNSGPVITSLPEPTTIQCPATPQFTTPTAIDACGGAVDLTSADTTTPGACPNERSVTRTWTAVDLCGNVTTASQTISVEDKIGPVITELPAPSTIQCPAMPEFTTPTATDACGGAVDLTFNDMTTPGYCPMAYSVTRTWTAVDLCGNVTTASQTIAVEDTTGPEITPLPEPMTVQCGGSLDFVTPTAKDNCSEYVRLTFVDEPKPGSCPQKYSVTRIWTATDECGNTSTASQTISVENNNPPVILGLPEGSTIECPAMPNFATPTAKDACGGAVNLTFADEPTPGGCPNEHSVTRTWTAVDACGHTTTASQTITVQDLTPPTLLGVPGDKSVPCGGPVPGPCDAEGVTVKDDCDPNPTLTCLQTISAHGQDETYYVTNCWTATDACGNTVEQCQLITMQACGASLCVLKFYDRTADGIQNFGEPGIAGWKFTVTGPNGYSQSGFTDTNGTYCFNNLPGGTYMVTEAMPQESSWSSTTPTSVQVIMQGNATTVKFGNLCIGAGGADGTPGYWQSKNGENRINDGPDGAEPELLMLRNLCLRTATGADFDPTCYTGCTKSLKDWLKGSKAVNMANQLSSHLACAALNVESGLQSGNSLIYVPGATSANAQGYALLSSIINEANQLLCQYGSMPSGHPQRAYAAMLKDALASVNNNTGVVQPNPCPHTFAP